MRKEKDHIGEMILDENALYGIYSVRAKNNFPDTTLFAFEWYKAMAEVKLAYYKTILAFLLEAEKKYSLDTIPLKVPEKKVLEILCQQAKEATDGTYYEHFIVSAMQGSASINMNMNEILTNAALLAIQRKPGDYAVVDPVRDANIFQSPNDVVPSALKVALMRLFNRLEDTINKLRASIEHLEQQYRYALRIGYTHMQEAVPSSFGRLFGSYSEALSRDWWRVSKCFERIKFLNLGGSIIGTSISVPRYIVMEVVRTLREITGLPLAKSDNLADSTSNHDALVEVHAILKAHAVTLEKMVSDLRLLASDVTKEKTIIMPQQQTGCSVMPGEIHPEIFESVISAAHRVYANDMLVAGLCAQGCLDLNAYIPTIGHAMVDSVKLLIACNETLLNNVFVDLKVRVDVAQELLFRSPAITTALVPYIGYNEAGRLAFLMQEKNIDIRQANAQLQCIDDKKLEVILSPGNLLKAGFTLGDIINDNETR